MQLKTIILATSFALTSSLAFAQSAGPAPIGSDADAGNGAQINRAPDASPGEDRDFRTNRSPGITTGGAPFESGSMRRDRSPTVGSDGRRVGSDEGVVRSER
jgi:hypothetical protein